MYTNIYNGFCNFSLQKISLTKSQSSPRTYHETQTHLLNLKHKTFKVTASFN